MQMAKFDCKLIAYYGKRIDSLTRDELKSAIEELATGIYDFAVKNKRRSEIKKVNTRLECSED